MSSSDRSGPSGWWPIGVSLIALAVSIGVAMVQFSLGVVVADTNGEIAATALCRDIRTDIVGLFDAGWTPDEIVEWFKAGSGRVSAAVAVNCEVSIDELVKLAAEHR